MPFERALLGGLAEALAALGSASDPALLRGLVNWDGGPQADAALPVHRLAAAAHLPAPEFATRLGGAFRTGGEIAAVSTDGAYLNFVAAPERIGSRTLATVFALGERYGHRPPAAERACVEHTSANPTGPFHIGRVRNAIIGDTLARTLRAAGTPVTTQYYVDDMGRQAAMISWIWGREPARWPEEIRATLDGAPEGEKADAHRGRPYPAVSAYLKTHPEAAAEVAAVVEGLESGRIPERHRALAEEILGGMVASLGRLGIAFDEFVWESEFVRNGAVASVLDRLHAAPHARREENGAWAIDAGGYGLPKEKQTVVVQRGNGTSLYVTRDVAYHLAKFARFARVVDVLGQDHQLHARTLEALLAEIGEARRPEFVIYQDITVPEGGRMSTRGGSAVWLDQLLAEAVERARGEVRARREGLADDEVDRIAEAVATGAVRYHIVRVAPEKPVVFRWEDALSFEGRSGPFCQYAYARATSVLGKAAPPAASGAGAPPYPYDVGRLGHPDERALLRLVARFPRTVEGAARRHHVHAIAGYAHDVADQFNRFYHAVPVLRAEAERSSRLALVAAVRQTLGNALDLLGVARLDSM